MVLAGLGYAYLIAWNINSVSHNFIHNPYFVSPALNRAYSLVLSLCMAFSQVMYDWVHTRHHIGNMDRPGPDGQTIDPISIYRYGRLYNWLWLNNGYHAEHHFRPRLHWTQMKKFHRDIAQRQQAARVRVINWPHCLGFLDRH